MNDYMIEKIFKHVMWHVLYTLICFILFYYIAIPNVIEHRARYLSLMQYSADKDKMIMKDSISLTNWEMHYLQYGTFDGY